MLLRWSPAPWSFTLELRLSKNAGVVSFTDKSKHSIYLKLGAYARLMSLVKRSLYLCVCVARRIQNHNNGTSVAKHNTQYETLLVLRGYSTVYYAQNNSRVYRIMLAIRLCLKYACFCDVGSGERPKMQGTSLRCCNRCVNLALSKTLLRQQVR